MRSVGEGRGKKSMSKMPKQKPGQSEQVVCTPTWFLESAKKKLGITQWDWDLAASHDNAVADDFYTEKDDALIQEWPTNGGWNWCNPPYEDIEPWVKYASFQSLRGSQTAMLVPASVGSNWWRDWVDQDAYVLFLNGRLTFEGHTSPYPKDLALLLYSKAFMGYDVWNWRKE